MSIQNRFIQYNKNHCWQYDIRLKNYNIDLKEANLTEDIVKTLTTDDFNFEYGGGFNPKDNEKAGFFNTINRRKYQGLLVQALDPLEVIKGNLSSLRPVAERYAAFRLPDEKTAKKLEKEYSPVNVKVDIPIKDIFTKEEYDSLFVKN